MKYILLNIIVGIFLLISCDTEKKSNSNMNKTQDQSNKTTNIENNKQSLKSQLDVRKEEFERTADDMKKEVYAAGIQSIVDNGIMNKSLKKGDIAPNFTLKNALGETVDLYQYLKKGKVILTWYRGGWCPYCNLTLHHLGQELPNFKANGATLIALTPELPDKSLTTSEKHNLKYEVLSDIGNKVARIYGIVFKLTDKVAKIYNKAFNLNEYNGDDSNELPLAATYVINEDGKIIYAFLDADYRKRAEPSELTKILQEKK